MDRLRADLESLGSVMVAFSGGVDSAFLAHVAHETLGPDRARSVTAVSPSLAAVEGLEAAALAEEWGLRWTTVETDEMDSAAYRTNDANRCVHCKVALLDAVGPLADAAGSPVLLGDVVLCPAVAAGQASDHNREVDAELSLLVVHGILHLLGYDHADPEERVVMQRLEQELLERHARL